MFWDAYSASIPARPDVALSGLQHGLGTCVRDVVEGRGLHSYTCSQTLFDVCGRSIGVLWSGGRNPQPHFRTQGHYAENCAKIIRTLWPDRTVSRADASFDLCATGLFDRLSDRFQNFAKEHRLRWNVNGDWRSSDLRDPIAGRTFYVGSRTSLALLRVYEKGKQLLPAWTGFGEMPPLDWVRVELEVKPQDREGKQKLARLTPQAAWGVSAWTRAAYRELIGTSPERVIMWQPKETVAEESIRRMAMQYRENINKVAALKGGPEAFMRFLEEIWRDQDRMRGQLRH